VVASVFVNPTQFGQGEDFARYPRQESADAALLASAGCDLLFLPDVATIYPPGGATWVSPEGPAEGLEGAFRPGHFRGVATVVLKLLLLVAPDVAVFGEKDAQQLAVIRQLVADLFVPVTIVAGPTVREADGLAMSSRNRRLTPSQRLLAPLLYQALQKAQTLLANGQTTRQAHEAVTDHLSQSPEIVLEYFEIVETRQMTSVTGTPATPYALCIAAYLGSIRLIDNILVNN